MRLDCSGLGSPVTNTACSRTTAPTRSRTPSPVRGWVSERIQCCPPACFALSSTLTLSARSDTSVGETGRSWVLSGRSESVGAFTMTRRGPGGHGIVWRLASCAWLAQWAGCTCQRAGVVTSESTAVYGTQIACLSAVGTSLEELRRQEVVGVVGPGFHASVSAIEHSKDGRCLLLTTEDASGWVVDDLRTIRWLRR